MKTGTRLSATGISRVEIDYTRMTLLQLSDRIVRKSDFIAMKELHDNRAVFRHGRQEAQRLVEYIATLAQCRLARRWCGYDDMVLDQGLSLCVDKFSNMPIRAANGDNTNPGGPDCRYYFKAFIDYTEARLRADKGTNAVRREIIAAEILRRLVTRHFYLSCLEFRRRVQKSVRRYIWKLNGHTLYLWIPIELPGQQCQKWLEANIPDLDPARLGEQDRVQAVVNRLLGRRQVFSLSSFGSLGENMPTKPLSSTSVIGEQISVNGLAEAVAREKSENIEGQRPAIRRLGKDKLKQLVRTIFAELACDNYEEKRIATSFELSAATFGRFAGSRWNHNFESPAAASIPDLWRNTAQTLAGHPDFVLAAQSSGVWKRVSAVLAADDDRRKT